MPEPARRGATMRIGELAERVGVNPKTIRFYEEIGLLPEPERRPSGYREYGPDDVNRLTFIRTAQALGLPLADIGEILAFKERGEAPCTYVRAALAREVEGLDQRIAELRQLRDQLRALQAKAADLPSGPSEYCGIIEHAHALVAPAGARAPVRTNHRARSHRR